MISHRGFTLIELLIVVAIISITMSIGLPSYNSIIASSRLTSAANAMVSALQLARMEALKQHKPVVVAKNTSWENGWIVYVDNPKGTPPVNNYTQDSDEPTFATFDALPPSITSPVGTGKGTYSSQIYYKADGRVNNDGHFAFCSDGDFRKVVIAATGRVHVETPTSCS